MSNETQDDIEVISPGSILKNAREEQGLTREAVADKLHLRLQIIVDLEEDNYSADISATFTRGYIKLYSRLLGLDYNKVLDAYQQMNAQEKEPAKLQSFSQKVSKQASDQRLMMFTYFIIIIVLALVVMWWLQQGQFSTSASTERDVSSSTPQQQITQNKAEMQASASDEVKSDMDVQDDSQAYSQAYSQGKAEEVNEPETDITSESLVSSSDTGSQPDAVDTSAQVEQVVEDSAVAMNTAADDAEEVSSDMNNAIQDSSSQEMIAQEATAQEQNSQDDSLQTPQEITVRTDNTSDSANSDSFISDTQADIQDEGLQGDSSVVMSHPVELVFTFAGDCWIKITDATGEDIAYGVKVSGRVMPVSGIPPFEVVLGAPESVQISYGGEPVDMSRFRAGYTARFELPLGE